VCGGTRPRCGCRCTVKHGLTGSSTPSWRRRVRRALRLRVGRREDWPSRRGRPAESPGGLAEPTGAACWVAGRTGRADGGGLPSRREDWPSRRERSAESPGGLAEPTGRPCRVAGRPCRVTGRLCRVTGRPCRVTGRLCRVAGRLCRVTGRPCRVAGNLKEYGAVGGPADYLDGSRRIATRCSGNGTASRCSRSTARSSGPHSDSLTTWNPARS